MTDENTDTQNQVRCTLRESSDRFDCYCCPERRQSWDKPQMHSCGLEVHGPSVQLQHNLLLSSRGRTPNFSWKGTFNIFIYSYLVKGDCDLWFLNCIYDMFTFRSNVSAQSQCVKTRFYICGFILTRFFLYL